jgi:glycosyltransferase involved in cell wall biosynthesis
MKNLLWLTEWFPTRVQPYAGDGIERRAKAASIYNRIHIIHVKKDTGLRFPQLAVEERVYNANCRAMIYYYPSVRHLSRLLDIVLSNFYFVRLHFKAVRSFKRNYGKPEGIQVNVTMKNGLIALYYRWVCGIPYIVVEGNGFFLPEAKPNFIDENSIFRFLTRTILRRSSLLVTVSDTLARSMINRAGRMQFLTIPSVVDSSIFYPSPYPIPGPSGCFRFMHVSSLDYPKNFEDIMQALKLVIQQGYRTEMRVHGPDRPQLKKMVSDLALEDAVTFLQEAPQTVIADSMRWAHAFILYSRYESFGNVIIEANACGLPVIVSDYPTFREIIIEGVTGITAAGKNPKALAEKMIFTMDNYQSFNTTLIAAATIEKYGFDSIGRQLDEVYKKIF